MMTFVPRGRRIVRRKTLEIRAERFAAVERELRVAAL